MAIRIGTKTNTTLVDPAYPLGRFKDDSGIGDGTPLNLQTHGDIIQTFVRLLDRSGLGAGNNLADNATNGYELYEALGYWQAGGTTLEFFESDMTTVAATIVGANVRYNKFKVLGNSMTWQVQLINMVVLGTQNELYFKFPPAILTLLGNAFIDNNNGYQLGMCDNGVGYYEPLYIKQDITTDSVVLTMKTDGSVNFAAGINVQFNITVPLI